MDNKKINYTVIIAVLLLVGSVFSGCKRYSDEYTTVEFVIVNPVTQEPFVGVPVQILEIEGKNKGPVSELFREGVTNANGRITFKFKAAETSKYTYMPIIDDSYFGPEGDWEYLARPPIFFDPIKKNQYNEMRYEITYHAYIKEEYKNVNCEGSTDTLKLTVDYKSLDHGTTSQTRHITLPGCYHFISDGDNIAPPGYIVRMMGKYVYEYKVIRPSGVTYGKDSIYLDKGEMGEMKIFY